MKGVSFVNVNKLSRKNFQTKTTKETHIFSGENGGKFEFAMVETFKNWVISSRYDLCR